MITTVCLYIAGTLFAVNGDRAMPIGPHESIRDHGKSVTPARLTERVGIPKFHPDQTLAEFLAQCDEQATRKVMEREEW